MIFDFSEEYKRVVEFNIKAGKLPEKITQEDIDNQEILVQEEKKEYLDELQIKPAVRNDINLLKEIIDVFVVVSYRDFLEHNKGREDELLSLDLLASCMIKEYDEYETYKTAHSFMASSLLVDQLPALIDVLSSIHFKSEGINLKEAIRAVLDNNDLKIHTSYENVAEEYENFDATQYYIDSNVYAGNEYYTIKRKSDNKIMKGKKHPKCDLSKYMKGE